MVLYRIVLKTDYDIAVWQYPDGESMYEIIYDIKNPNEKEERKHRDYYDDDTNINAVKQSLKERGAKNIKISSIMGRR